MIASAPLGYENAIALLLVFVASSAASAGLSAKRQIGSALALSVISSLAIWTFAYAMGHISLLAAPFFILNGVSIAFLAKKGSQRDTSGGGNKGASGLEENTAAALALIRNYEEIEAFAKERTLFMLRRSKQLREALKTQESLNELQRSFTTMLSHEFRTPLAIIDSSAQKLKSRAGTMTSVEVAQRADAIRAAIRRLTALMEKILASAKYEDGNLPLTFRRCDLRHIVVNCIDTVAETCPHHRINIELDHVAEILGDQEALNQLFDNLLRNAVKYSPNANQVDVRVRSANHGVTVEIEDYGQGIDGDDLPKLFQRFFRARNAEGIEGTGIGLSVVKLIAEQHGGEVTVASRKGQGTTFRVCLPAAEAVSQPMPEAVGG
jgi:signal transduction histidine kinase